MSERLDENSVSRGSQTNSQPNSNSNSDTTTSNSNTYSSTNTHTSRNGSHNGVRNHSIKVQIPENPFEHTEVRTYKHQPNTVPPYVLDTLSKDPVDVQQTGHGASITGPDNEVNPSMKSTHSKQTEEDQFLSYANDPFVKAMGQDWNKFLTSVEQPQSYTSDKILIDNNYSFAWNLNGEWKGDERLRDELEGAYFKQNRNENQERAGFFRRYFSMDPVSEDKESPRVRSTAGYWMSGANKQDMITNIISSSKRMLVRNPLIPLFLRILIILFSACALALACNIFVSSKRKYNGSPLEEQPSTIMAIVVQCCAVLYVIYIAYDEYHGEPLGLRDPLGKMKLIMLDLLFIIFSSANLSLTLNTLYDDEWVCKSNNKLESVGVYSPVIGPICRRQRALAAFLFLVLCLWVVTFTISIIRVVDRVTTSGPRNE
ncbi:predicted protein [Scheffersomyces stipitis CBS 6054]|uniref:Regulator of phospholipase D SRF1 n=1 Tax=Scheffersomyces stipitis (strain ATCC 58785 / CBS 6054 / NBRC 10063 / NRRL Y-11545) TaxID=322104 RepID=A3LP01_PICST|nr:predicted protein [Scheffersomyces stipitis CBS 6054]ABN64962.2 predicted protein [Scheffersomyces stipitis CBS 6054]